MKHFIHKVNQIMAGLSGLSLGFIMVFLLIDVISRTISRPILGASEMAVFAMIIAVYLGVPYCEEKKGHVRVEALLCRLPYKYRRILNLLSYFLVFLMLGIVVFAVGKYALSTYNTSEAIPGPRPIRIFPVIFVMFVSCVFYWIQVLLNLLEAFREFNKKS
jgi:TRAP-type C4-dicarboxylate transport system permease small subunit